MKKITNTQSVFVLVLFFLAVWFFLQEKEIPIINFPPQNDSIIVFGDSLVRGVGASEGKDFVSVLSKRVEREILNFGKPGDTTEMALNRIPTVFDEVPNPGVVMVLLGGNDFLQGKSKEETFNNLSKIVQIFQNKGTVVILIGVRGGIIKDSYKDDYKMLSKRYGTGYVPNILSGLIGRSQFMYDSIHPNDIGYEEIANKVEPVLRKVLSQ